MDNLKGAALMTLAMAIFAVEDALIKFLTTSMPAGQIIAALGAGGTIVLIAWQVFRKERLWSPHYLNSRVLLRSLCEVIGTVFFVTALANIPLTTASAVIQATPLVIAVGAALFLGQHVGWRRWGAILVGFAGVLLILRPGTEAFTPLTLLAFGGMLGLASRDIATRAINVPISAVQLSIHAFICLCPAGLLLVFYNGQSLVWPESANWLVLGLAALVGLFAYLTIVGATRIGDAAVIASFRYSRMVFALIVGYIVFREVPDNETLIGVTIVIAAGIFTVWREAKLRKASPR